MLQIRFANRMKRDVKRLKKRGKDLLKLETTLDILASQRDLPERYKDHSLKGEWQDFRECHIEPDWLLIYKIEEQELILYATATGSHADLFEM